MYPHLVIIVIVTIMIQLSPTLSYGEFKPFTDPKAKNSTEIVTPKQVEVDGKTGSVSYEYPIFSPAGTGGLTPQLSLRFSSLTQQSEYGWGWGISFFQEITRSSRFGIPQYNSNVTDDRFELDGSLLVEDPGNSDATCNPSCRFHLVQNDFSRVIYFGGATDKWEVTQVDGTIHRFGSRSGVDSKLLHEVNEKTYSWKLDEIEDINGNIVRIDYTNPVISPFKPSTTATSDAYPSVVRYSYNNGAALGSPGSRSIEFTWEEIPVTPELTNGENCLSSNYRSGFGIYLCHRLAEVEVRYAGNLILRYKMEYDPGVTIRGKLLNIKRWGNDSEGDDSKKNFVTTFEYTSDPDGFKTTAHIVDIPNRATGIEYGRDVSIDYGTAFFERWDSDSIDWRAAPGFLAAENEEKRIDGASVESAMTLDVTGDGLPDRVVMTAGIGSKSSHPPPKDGTSKYTATITVFRGQRSEGDLFSFSATPEIWQQQDFDDYTIYPAMTNFPRRPTSEGTFIHHYGFHRLREVVANDTRAFIGWDLRGNLWERVADLIDMNGDGLPDRVISDPSGYWKVYFNTGSSFQPVAQTWFSNPMPFIGAENCDNDCRYYNAISATFQDGSGGTTGSQMSTGSYQITDLADIDGDGKPDLLFLDNPYWQIEEYGHLYNATIKVAKNLCVYDAVTGCAAGTLLFHIMMEVMEGEGHGINASAASLLGPLATGGLYGSMMQTQIKGLMDFNGDGLQDFVLGEQCGYYSCLYTTSAGLDMEDITGFQTPLGRDGVTVFGSGTDFNDQILHVYEGDGNPVQFSSQSFDTTDYLTHYEGGISHWGPNHGVEVFTKTGGLWLSGPHVPRTNVIQKTFLEFNGWGSLEQAKVSQSSSPTNGDITGDLNRSTQHRRHTAPPGFELQGLAGPLVEVVRRLF